MTAYIPIDFYKEALYAWLGMNCNISHRSACQKATTCIKFKFTKKIGKGIPRQFQNWKKLLKLLRYMTRIPSKVDHNSQRNNYWTFGKRFDKDKISLNKLFANHDKCHLCGQRQMLTHLFVTWSEAQFFGLSLLIGGTIVRWNSKSGDTNNIHKNEAINGV